MAGTLQTLHLNPLATRTAPFRRQPPFVPAINIPFFGGFSVDVSQKNSLLWKLRSVPGKPIKASEQSNQGNSGVDQPSGASAPEKVLNWTKPLLNFAANNFLPLALVGGVALGIANPTLGCLADRYYLSKFSTFGIFIISGLTLRSEEIGAATEAWPVGLFGLGSILLFTPFFSWLILQLPLQPQEFVTASLLTLGTSLVPAGLAIFNCMPTTLSSGVALTRLAGGNSALALAMTLISNLLGILIVPFSISKFIAAGVGLSVPTKQLFKSLVLTLLVPLILGKVIPLLNPYTAYM
ncbi:unnamed protein product [Ilex paraguariensis]|uniref:Sodium/metabolite cotransporter BASS4, chloroplastic n=1 Tax=Ilex paraguariensis TaxID=185542 RepID=A0ABC8RBT2_9AQUA